MMPVLGSLLLTLRDSARSRTRLQLELLALRHQLQVLQRTRPRRVPLTMPVLAGHRDNRGDSTNSIVFKADDNEFVRRLLAAVMLVLFTSLNAMDGVCCPDGCTQEEQSPAQQHHSESSDGICVLCLGGVDSSASQDLSPCGIVMDRVGLPSFAHHLDVPPDPAEHPPRS